MSSIPLSINQSFLSSIIHLTHPFTLLHDDDDDIDNPTISRSLQGCPSLPNSIPSPSHHLTHPSPLPTTPFSTLGAIHPYPRWSVLSIPPHPHSSFKPPLRVSRPQHNTTTTTTTNHSHLTLSHHSLLPPPLPYTRTPLSPDSAGPESIYCKVQSDPTATPPSFGPSFFHLPL